MSWCYAFVSRSPGGTLHEIFHHLWSGQLSDSAREVLSAAVSEGAQWPGNYYDSVSERTARLFQSWAWSRLEGMPRAANEHGDALTVDWLFEWIWSGKLADSAIRNGLVPHAEALRIRRGLQPLPPPEPEPLPAPPPRPRAWATWSATGFGMASRPGSTASGAARGGRGGEWPPPREVVGDGVRAASRCEGGPIHSMTTRRPPQANRLSRIPEPHRSGRVFRSGTLPSYQQQAPVWRP